MEKPTMMLSVVACWEGHITWCRGQKLRLVGDLEGHSLGKKSPETKEREI